MIDQKKTIQLVVSGVLALVFVNFYLKQKEESITSGFGMVEVLAASRDIPPRTPLAPSMLTTKMVPQKYVEPGAFRLKIPGQAFNRVLQRVTIPAIPAGAQILQSDLYDTENGMKLHGIAPLLPPGKVGYLLRLGNTDVSQIILPGDRINIIATFTIRQNAMETKAAYTILQDVLVLNVGRELRKPDEDVTSKKDTTEALILGLALEPRDAERMELAKANSQGDISVVVRSHGDSSVTSATGVTTGDLLNTSPQVPVPGTPPAHK